MSIRPPADVDPADVEREIAGELDGVDPAALAALEADLTRAAPRLDPSDDPLLAEPALDADDFDAGRLAAWARGEVPGAEAEAITAQLAESPARRALLAHLGEPLPAALTARMVEAVAPRRRRRGPLIAGAAVVVTLAAGLLVFVQPPLPPPPPGFEAPRLSGGVVQVKSDVTGGTCFVPDSQLTLRLIPRATLQGTLAGRAYESAPPGSPLRALPGAHLTQKPGGAFVLAARAGDLFGEAFGPRTLYLGVAVNPEPLGDAAGDDPPAADPDVAVDGVRWHAVSLTFDPSCSTP